MKFSLAATAAGIPSVAATAEMSRWRLGRVISMLLSLLLIKLNEVSTHAASDLSEIGADRIGFDGS
jgi:hypothetical protein